MVGAWGEDERESVVILFRRRMRGIGLEEAREDLYRAHLSSTPNLSKAEMRGERH